MTEKGFDEYMNLVMHEAEELSIKKKTRRPIGTSGRLSLTTQGHILLKGENVTLISEV